MITCPQCKSEIDPDSQYCDQCGVLLYFCPSCRIIGKGEGKRCGQCGKPLVSAIALKNMPEQEPVKQEPEKSPVPPVSYQATVDVRPPEAEAKTIVCSAQGVRLQLIDNAVIGRVNGNYVNQLSNMIYISGTHARLNKNGNQWSITDLGSRNGTKVNGITCSPTLNFTVGDTIRIANFYDFKVE